jgi:hypothetical protein
MPNAVLRTIHWELSGCLYCYIRASNALTAVTFSIVVTPKGTTTTPRIETGGAENSVLGGIGFAGSEPIALLACQPCVLALPRSCASLSTPVCVIHGCQ